MVAELQETIFGIVAFSAIRAGNKAPNVRAFAVKIFSNRETRATTAGNEEHAHRRWFLCLSLRALASH